MFVCTTINLNLSLIRMGILTLSAVMSCPACASKNHSTKHYVPEFDRIDTLHHVFSENFHKHLSTRPDNRMINYQSPKLLKKAVKDLTDKNENMLAVSLIIRNIPMLKNNYDNLVIFDFIDLLLVNNEWNSANLLYNWLKKEGDRTLVSNTSYLFAKYSFKRQKWRTTLNYLENSINDLAGEEYNYALLMQGIAHQHLKNHRTAIVSYKKIPDSSNYYVSARLNMAIANIRQGWWTDGYLLIKHVLNKPQLENHEESLSRLYLTLGYSFLNQEYYRDSREAFRNVGTDNSHTNSALLGISLSAANQEDYIGALNAVRILKEKKTFELPVDEAHLLMPYYYEKLQQDTTATSAYTEAIQYYQGRISDIKNILQSDLNISKLEFSHTGNTSVSLNGNPINISLNYPDYFIENYILLKTYRPHLALIDNPGLNAEYHELQKKYETEIDRIIRNILEKRIEYLHSYMDQCRFGLARLYDNNLVAGK